MSKKAQKLLSYNVDEIIKFKRNIKANYEGKQKNKGKVEDFIELLTKKETLKNLPKLKNIENKKYYNYFSNYMHACILSIFMIKEGYTLDNWNSYIEKISTVLVNNKFYKDYMKEISTANMESSIFELFILHTINYEFKLPNIYAVTKEVDDGEYYLIDDTKMRVFVEQAKIITDTLKINMNIRGSESKGIWGDNDIIVVAHPEDEEKAEAICIISCKTSLRERVYQSVFWATHSRIQGIAKHTFATLDKGDATNLNTEIGHRKGEKTRKTRDVLESTMERVYVFRGEDKVGRSEVIKDLTYLKTDLERWREDHFGLKIHLKIDSNK